MPTFTAVALDRLIEPRSPKTMAAGKYIPDPKPESRRNNTPTSNLERVTSLPALKSERGVNVPKPKANRTNNVTTTKVDRKHHWARISPALYTTPESTPLPVVPDSPSSFPPSPYIINHKRRGPRLLKSLSVDDISTSERASDEEKAAENVKNEEKASQNGKDDQKEVVDTDKEFDFTFNVPVPVDDDHVNVVSDGELGKGEFSNGLAAQNGTMKSIKFDDGLQDAELDDFFDPQDSMSVKSNNTESSHGMERSLSLAAPMAEFYDAWEELSSESGTQQSVIDVEAEMREIRLGLLMEIEKRKQAEEALNDMRSHWLRIRQQLSIVGLTFPADPIDLVEDEQVGDPADELRQQVHLARFVSNSIGRGTAKAEVEAEMEAQLEAKNFEIARLWDRLNYYETVNHEMSQRNQEAVETARRLRQSRKRKQRWVWGTIAAAITIGTAALAWSYLPTAKGSSSPDSSDAPNSIDSSK